MSVGNQMFNWSKACHWRDLSQFYQTQLGGAVLQTEVETINFLLKSICFEKICLISPLLLNLTTSAPILFLTPSFATPAANADALIQNFFSLPLVPDSQELIICHHVADFCKNQKQLKVWLNEVYQALKPGGQVIVSYFNWKYLWRLLLPIQSKHAVPSFHPHYPLTQERLYREIGFKLLSHQNFFFRPPLQHHKKLDKLNWVENMGKLVLDELGMVNLDLIQKKTLTLSLDLPALIAEKNKILPISAPMRVEDGK